MATHPHPEFPASPPAAVRRGRGRRPRGIVLIVALVALLIVSALLGNMLRGAVRDRRYLRTLQQVRQTELLVDAAAQRARLRLTADPDYRGETWDLPSDQIVGSGDARVTIAATRNDGSDEGDDDQPWQVRIVAEYPLHSDASIRRSRTVTVQTPTPSDQE